MIKRFNQYNESLLNKLEGPSEKDFTDYLLTLEPEKALLRSIDVKHEKSIINSLKRIDGELDIELKYFRKLFEVLNIDKNLKEINKIIKDIDLLYEYSYTYLFKDGLVYCYDKVNKKDIYILEDIVFNGEDYIWVEDGDYKREDENLVDCINTLIDNGLNLKTISVHDLCFILYESQIKKLEKLFIENMTIEQISDMLVFDTSQESANASLFIKLLEKKPSQSSKDKSLKNLTQYVEDISDNKIYFFVSKLLENGAKPSDKTLKKISNLKNGDKDDLKVYNLFKKYFDI